MALYTSHKEPMLLASSTFFARPTQKISTPEANFSALWVRSVSCRSRSRYCRMGPAMSCGNSVTNAPKVTMFLWARAWPRYTSMV